MTTLVFSRGHGFVSDAIAWFTGSRASHCMIGFEVFGQAMLLHCTAGGVQVTPRTKWFRDNVLISEHEFVPDMTASLQRGFTLIGVRYDYLTLFGWGFAILCWRWLRLRVRNPLQSPTAMVCSEFVARVGQPVIPEWRDLDPEATNCADLQKLVNGPSFRSCST